MADYSPVFYHEIEFPVHEVVLPNGFSSGPSVTLLRHWIEDDANGLNGIYGYSNLIRVDLPPSFLFWFTDANAAFAFKMRWR